MPFLVQALCFANGIRKRCSTAFWEDLVSQPCNLPMAKLSVPTSTLLYHLIRTTFTLLEYSDPVWTDQGIFLASIKYQNLTLAELKSIRDLFTSR